MRQRSQIWHFSSITSSTTLALNSTERDWLKERRCDILLTWLMSELRFSAMAK